ncbi:HNH endonuclease [Nostoc sp. FACHB-110]|uniref:HNH endonuclease n=1 Tax=Nostoc sp. FACHB-110 TaxID=2692834 RepID=UPI001681FB2F|nr:HNH endonuclease [Nostoc sp. FACHB-110]MBD2441357.1 HNH endonuclease [Nostoc sp. FACHB-110]
MSQDVYPPNWKQIAIALKDACNWRCTRCDRLCLRPEEKAPHLTLSQRKAYTLQVHHWNRDPSDNRLENLVCLCSGCHLYYHRFGRGNVSPGQLSLFDERKVC